MKKAMILLVGILFSGGIAIGQSSVKQAFESESGSAFTAIFDSNVDTYVMGKDRRLSKAEAVKVMDSFFATHAVNGVKMVHSGESRGQGSNYEIYELSTNKKAYRVYVYYKTDGGKKLVSELRIEDN